MVQVTKEFVRWHATIHYPDGYSDKSQQNVSYVEEWDRGNSIELREINDDSWYAEYSEYRDEPYIEYSFPAEESIILSTENFERIEGSYRESLVAVAEVSVEEEVEQERLLRSDVIDYDVTIDSLEIWEQHEWEAYSS